MHNPNFTSYQQHVHPAIHLLQQWQMFMSGLDRVMLFYQLDNKALFEGLEWNQQTQQQLSTPIQLSNDTMLKLTQITKEKNTQQWTSPELLPFVQASKLSLSQLDLFSENNYLVLLVPCTINSRSILSYLFFRNDCSNFGMSDSHTTLDTSHKAIIGKMASRFAQMTINNYQTTIEQNNQFKLQTQKLLEHKYLEDTESKESFASWKNQWMSTYLLEASKRDGVNYVISQEAAFKLINLDLSYSVTQEIIDNAVIYICNLYNVQPGDDVIIKESLLVIPRIEQQETSVPATEPINRQSKTILLLDRLEESAIRLQQQGHSITSSDVGANMPKAISAPAISDALRKNKTRILNLFEQYPERWSTIRSYFKPIINLSAKKNQFLRASS
ncbi:hypothetical protein [Carboxylicivirga sp. M1479]|uniref:hypothetical protein n=1 Tax=Carboxylicivirga sp. M1479 TaxID=2594476 RepID=UPI0011778FD4|nr:hypothetical protein [Carboxylicivirga sp. M1479]TRX70582.1 hypothetical protein FNN09_11435 [Carboxylicivirga sp. M1479]